MNCPYNVKICTKCNKLLIACKINFRKGKRGKYGFRAECKECESKYKKTYNKQYRENHKEEIKKYKEEYRKENKEKIAEGKRKWCENNPHKLFNSHNKRRQKLKNQGRGITDKQWYEMFEFFNWECAYSGVQLNKNNRNVDHIVAIDNNGLNEIWNCVPCYNKYNCNKRTRDMLDWYKQQPFYSEERLEKIYAWIEYAYEKWGYKRRKGNKKIGNF